MNALSRRRLLIDLTFVGGVMVAAALLTSQSPQAARSSATPSPTKSPRPAATRTKLPEYQRDGEFAPVKVPAPGQPTKHPVEGRICPTPSKTKPK